MPGINAVHIGDGSFSLTGTNVMEPATYEWYSQEMDKVGEGQTVIVNREDVGDVCVLKVTLEDDGNEGCAVTNLDNVMPMIELVSPVPLNGDAEVVLTSEAVEAMSVRVVSITGNQNVLESSISTGERYLVLPTANLPTGQYAICLLHNGEIIQSVNVVK